MLASCAMAICCLMLMAYIPFYASPLHFMFAVLTFVFLGIAQGVDAAQAVPPYRCAKWTILVLMLASFFGWVVSPLLVGMPISFLEYIATFLPWIYFLTWTIQT